MQEFRFIKRKPPPITILGFILVIGSGIALFSVPLKAILPLILGVAIFSFYEGYKISINKKAYMDYKLLFGFKIYGKWVPLDSLEYIGLVRVKHSQRTWVSSISSDLSELVVNLNFVQGKRKYSTITSGTKKEILPVAMEIAKCAGLKIFDVTTPEKKWIDPNEVS